MQTKTKTNYQALLERIKSANTEPELIYRECQVTKHYNAGTISIPEFIRLDGWIMEILRNNKPSESLNLAINLLRDARSLAEVKLAKKISKGK